MDEPALTALRPFAAALAVCVGAIVGSFVNVVIARVPRGESVVTPRSRCPRCGAPIAWYDNVPILSFVLLRGRCRACRARISARYPLVEALVAAAAYASWRRYALGAEFAAELALVATLVALAFIDLETWLLPHALTWPLLAAGVAASALGASPTTAGSSLAGAAAGFVAFAAVAWAGKRLLRKEALGFGDVWLLSALGAWLGAKALLPIVLLASLQGSAAGVVLVLLGRGTPGRRPEGAASSEIASSTAPQPPTSSSSGDEEWVPPRHAVPFGPFLALGALEWLYFSDALARLVPPLGSFR